MLIFGKEVNIKNYHCDSGFGYKCYSTPRVSLYVQVTPECNAKCKFCNTRQPASEFNMWKLREILTELIKSREVVIKRVAITGGEPLLYPERIKGIAGMSGYVTLNTNAYDINVLREVSKYVNEIHISKHHYDNNINNKILGIKTPTMCEIYDYGLSRKTTINCVWQQDGISTIEDLEKMLDKAAMFHFHEIHVLSLMPLNEYAKSSYVDIDIAEKWAEKFISDEHPEDGTMFDRYYIDRCRCFQFHYHNKYDSIKCILKQVTDVSDNDCCRQLVYDGQYLYDGFHKNNILY